MKDSYLSLNQSRVKILLPFLTLCLFSCHGKSSGNPEKTKPIMLDPPELVFSEPGEAKLLNSDYIIEPVNELNSDKSLQDFVEKLKKAIAKKDTAWLLALVSDSVIVSWGGGQFGKIDFTSELDLQKPETSEAWNTFSQYINLGGAWDLDAAGEKEFVFPYFQSNIVLEKLNYSYDWYRVTYCFNAKTILYSKPDSMSVPVGYVRYSMLDILDNSNDDFINVGITETKVTGFVKAAEVECLANRVICIGKVGGKWKITSFAGFD